MVKNMKALISSIEPIQTGYRVAQVEQDANIFDVAEGFFWVDCADDVLADQFWFDPIEKTIEKIIPVVPVIVEGQSQPKTTGAQTL